MVAQYSNSNNITKSKFKTKGGLKINAFNEVVDINSAFSEIRSSINTHKGALFVSNFEYPDRYSRWDIGFINPAIELISRGMGFEVNALNGDGEILLKTLVDVLKGHTHLDSLKITDLSIVGKIKKSNQIFSEEERSKQPSIFTVVRLIMDVFKCKDPYLGLYGALGYDLVFQFEDLDQKLARDETKSDCHLYLPLEITLADRQKEHSFRVKYEIETKDGKTHFDKGGVSFDFKKSDTAGEIVSDHTSKEFEDKVALIREGCKRGDYFEVVLSQSFSAPNNQTPTELFNKLSQSNPSPYTFLINMGSEQILGASPEMYLRLVKRRIESCPIAGTVAIGKDPMETAERIKNLLSSEKEESELTMCTDVARNDLSRVCKPGSVKLIGRRLIERYSKLIHTVDHVEGVLAEGYDSIDAILSNMWACTLSGSPKPIAMQTIENMENSSRRWYGGAIGIIGFNGDLNTGMTLRTIHLEDKKATIRAGATLLYGSEPQAEERETRIKAAALMAILNTTKVEETKTKAEFNNGKNKTVLLVDNQDSFVHTLGNYFKQTGAVVKTFRNDFPYGLLDEIKPDIVVISPGPLLPKDFKISELVGEVLKREIPLFGVCLGHQGIAEHFGGKLFTLDLPMHGKPVDVQNKKLGVFNNLETTFKAARYHSIYVEEASLPDCLEISAMSEDGIIMGLRHKTLPIEAVQFHPESILSLNDEQGLKLINNVMGIC